MLFRCFVLIVFVTSCLNCWGGGLKGGAENLEDEVPGEITINPVKSTECSVRELAEALGIATFDGDSSFPSLMPVRRYFEEYPFDKSCVFVNKEGEFVDGWGDMFRYFAPDDESRVIYSVNLKVVVNEDLYYKGQKVSENRIQTVYVSDKNREVKILSDFPKDAVFDYRIKSRGNQGVNQGVRDLE